MGGSSTSSNKTTNNTTNYSLQGLDNAETAVAGNNNTVTVTDHGAVDAAFEFGNNVLDSNTDVSKAAIDSNTTLASKTVDFADSAIENGYEFSQSLVNQNTANSANSNLAVKELAQSLATGGSSDVAEQSTKMVYTMGAVFAVVVLGMLIMMMGRKR